MISNKRIEESIVLAKQQLAEQITDVGEQLLGRILIERQNNTEWISKLEQIGNKVAQMEQENINNISNIECEFSDILWRMQNNDNECFERILKKLDNIECAVDTVKSVKNNKYCITETRFESDNFLWVTNSDAMDFISDNAKKGHITIDPHLFSIFDKREGCFIDIGANIGAFSIPFAVRGWSGFAFEAGKENADVLQKSCCLNGFNIKVINKAVFDKTGEIYFVANGPWGIVKNQVFGTEEYKKMDALALDDWYKNEMVQSVDLIKMDIEGSEVATMRGMRDMLTHLGFPPIYTEVNTFALALQGETQYSYFKIVEELGYKIYEIYEDRLFEYSIDIFPLDYVRDYIFLKDIPDYMADRVFGRISNNDGRIEQILKRLQNYEQWSRFDKYFGAEDMYDYDSYLCINLRDYPEMVTDEIRELLLKIKQEKRDNILIQKNLEWIKN